MPKVRDRPQRVPHPAEPCIAHQCRDGAWPRDAEADLAAGRHPPRERGYVLGLEGELRDDPGRDAEARREVELALHRGGKRRHRDPRMRVGISPEMDGPYPRAEDHVRRQEVGRLLERAGRRIEVTPERKYLADACRGRRLHERAEFAPAGDPSRSHVGDRLEAGRAQGCKRRHAVAEGRPGKVWHEDARARRQQAGELGYLVRRAGQQFEAGGAGKMCAGATKRVGVGHPGGHGLKRREGRRRRPAFPPRRR